MNIFKNETLRKVSIGLFGLILICGCSINVFDFFWENSEFAQDQQRLEEFFAAIERGDPINNQNGNASADRFIEDLQTRGLRSYELSGGSYERGFLRLHVFITFDDGERYCYHVAMSEDGNIGLVSRPGLEWC